MSRSKTFTPLQVYIGSNLVGTLTRTNTGAHTFRYSDDWLALPNRLPISLSLPLRQDSHTGPAVLNYFDNLLPDEPTVRRKIATRLGAQGSDPFNILSIIGRDCIGAIRLIPENEDPHLSANLEGDILTEQDVVEILNELNQKPLGLNESQAAFRISVAGAQEKTALLFHNQSWILPHNSTPTTHIIKPSLGRISPTLDMSDSVENEYFCLHLMRTFGLETAKVDILTFGPHKVLSIQRFDRRWRPDDRLIRIPQEDMCQALGYPPSLKYQDNGGPGIKAIASLLANSTKAVVNQVDFLKAQILFFLIGATDGHAKNFSLFLEPQNGFKLTPMYDVMTVAHHAQERTLDRQKYRLSMHFGEKRRYRIHDIRGKDIMWTARKAGYPTEITQHIIQDISYNWEETFNKALDTCPYEIPEYLSAAIYTEIKTRMKQLHQIE